MKAVTSRYKVGMKVYVSAKFARGSRPSIAVLEKRSDYLGQPGWYVIWDCGRTREQWESAGGWMPERAFLGEAI